jgi:hypothetical protein
MKQHTSSKKPASREAVEKAVRNYLSAPAGYRADVALASLKEALAEYKAALKGGGK